MFKTKEYEKAIEILNKISLKNGVVKKQTES